MLFVDHFYNPELWRKMFRWFYVFPLVWNERGQKQTTLVTDLRNYRKENRKEKLPLDCAALCKGAGRTFLKAYCLD